MEQKIFKIVLSGGPCAGKTTLLNKINRESLAVPKLKVIMAPEAATFLKNSGINYKDAGADSTFQELILRQQISSEDAAFITAQNYLLANQDHTVIILCDRGIMDGEAYFDSPSDFDVILNRYALNREICYNRYDAVIYMHSAAVGARDFYTTSDGTPRDESPEEAAKLDEKGLNAWLGIGDKLFRVTNDFDFNKKLDVAIGHIYKVANLNIPKTICRRYIVNVPEMWELNSISRHFEMAMDKTIFIRPTGKNPKMYESIRIRKSGESFYYQLNQQRWDDNIEHPVTHEKCEVAVFDGTFNLSEKEVVSKLYDIDTAVPCLDRMVYSFYLSEAVYCELNVFNCNRKRAYLKAFFDCSSENIDAHVEKSLYPFFGNINEVTYQKKYCDYEIARTGGKVLDS